MGPKKIDLWKEVGGLKCHVTLTVLVRAGCESPTGELCLVSDYSKLSLVSTCSHHPLLEQEGPTGGEDKDLTPGRLLPTVRR